MISSIKDVLGMLKKLDFENWSTNLEIIYDKYFGKEHNILHNLKEKNKAIGCPVLDSYDNGIEIEE